MAMFWFVRFFDFELYTRNCLRRWDEKSNLLGKEISAYSIVGSLHGVERNRIHFKKLGWWRMFVMAWTNVYIIENLEIKPDYEEL